METSSINITKRYSAGLRALKCATIPALMVMAPEAANAAFIGAFDPVNWTFTNSSGGDGFVDVSGAPGSIFVQGANNSADGNNADYTITLLGSGSWSFDWTYQRFDSSANYDFGGYLLNGVFTSLATETSSGSIGPIAVLAGDTIGFRVNCSDCIFGPGRITISNFEAPGAVPEPSSLALMALGVAGLAVARRRRMAN